ncbi:MAG TPA: Dabb family protein [Gammaproteobacteria bacterium]|nr:Dabb family protein [Gammaproteobacteria bacterium]
MRSGTDRARLLAGLARLCTLWVACVSVPLQADGGIEHIVILWLNEPGNAQHRARILEESKVLAGIPGVLALQSGHVLASERAIVDSSFDVGLILSLEDQAALDSYLVHPLHVRLVNETLKPLVRRIQVYDLRQ